MEASGRVRAWIALLVAALTIAAYSAAFSAPFQFDDIPAIRLNPTIEHLLPISGALHPPPNTAVSGRPVVNVTLAVNYAINAALGVDQRADPDGPHKTVGYHVVNVAIHLACALLLFGVVRRSARRWASADDPSFAERIALFATAIWVVHPIHTEAIDYVVQRTELLVSLFYLATLYASIRAWDTTTRRIAWLVVGVVSCALGMASKEVMLTAPFLVPLYDRAILARTWREQARDRVRLAYDLALIATALVALVVAARDARGRTVGFDFGITWYQYLYTQAWAVAHYLRLLIAPVGLLFDYGERPITGARGLPGSIVLGAAAVATLVCWVHPRWRWLGFLGAAFFVILAPSSSVVPIATEIAAERRVYLASAAVITLAVICIDHVRRRFSAHLAAERGVIAAVVLACLATTWARSRVYADSEHLWRDVVAKAPENPRGYVGAARALLVKGPQRYREAERLLDRAIATDSSYLVAWQTLGRLALEERRFAFAAEIYDRVLRADRNNLDAMQGMTEALVGLGDSRRAIPYLERIGTADPSGTTLVTLANAYLAASRPGDAIEALRAAVQLNPALTDALWSLGGLLVEQGSGITATPFLETAVRRQPAALGLALLAVAYAQSARVEDAVRTAAAATAVAGDTARVYSMAGRAMIVAERPVEARRYLERAIALDPSLADVRESLRRLNAR